MAFFCWKLNPLCADLAAGRQTETDRFAYYFAVTALTTILLMVPRSDPANGWAWADMITGNLILITGLWLWFKANGGGQGHDFLGRAMALSWVIGLRLTVYTIPFFVIWEEWIDWDTLAEQSWYPAVYPLLDGLSTWFTTLWSLLFTAWVWRRMCFIVRRDPPQLPSTSVSPSSSQSPSPETN